MSKTSFPERTLETIRQACRLQHPLSGADAQALENALAQAECELAEATAVLKERGDE